MLHPTPVTDNWNMANGQIISGALIVRVKLKLSVCLTITPQAVEVKMHTFLVLAFPGG
jgi:hypothetical protein